MLSFWRLLAVLSAVGPPLLARANPRARPQPAPFSENADFLHLGCFEQTGRDASSIELRGIGGRAIVSTVEQCISICASSGNPYAGVGNGHECYCMRGIELKAESRVDDSKCDTPCDGDSSQACGGTGRFNWYKSAGLKKRYNTKPSTCSSKTVTSTCTRISWRTTVSTAKKTVTVRAAKTTTKLVTIRSVSTVTGRPTTKTVTSGATKTVTSGSTKTLTSTRVLSNSCSNITPSASSSRSTCSNPTVTVTLSSSGTCSRSTITSTDTATTTLTSTVIQISTLTEASPTTETSTVTQTSTLAQVSTITQISTVTQLSTLTQISTVSVCPPITCTNTPNLLNGGFEDQLSANPPWQPHYDGFLHGFYARVRDILPHSGQLFFAYFPSTTLPANRFIQQDIKVCPGSTYRASAYVATPSDSVNTPCSFRICLGQLCGIPVSPTRGAWQLYTTTFISTSESATVTLDYTCTPGSGNIGIDDVTVEAI